MTTGSRDTSPKRERRGAAPEPAATSAQEGQEPPRAAPGDLVTCFGCEGRWWGSVCDVCGGWGVVHVAQYADQPPRTLPAPLPAPVLKG